MDDRSPHEPLTDPAVDRAVADALDVQPSPEFVTRVRLRVAEAPASTSFRLLEPEATRLIYAGGLVMLALVAFALWRANPDSPAVAARFMQPVTVDVPHIAADAVSASSAAPVSVSRPVARVAAPDVLVEREEVETIMALVRQVQDGRLVMLAPGSAGPGEYAAPLEVTLAPITIEPLPRLAPLQETRQ